MHSFACIWLIFFGACANAAPDGYLFPAKVPAYRFFSVSGKSPVTQILRANATLQRAIDPAYRLFENLTSVIDKRRRENDFLACNIPASFRYKRNSATRMENRQIGQLEDKFSESCNSRIDVGQAVDREELPESVGQDAVAIIRTALEAFHEAASRIDVIPQKNWTRGIFRTFDFKRAQAIQNCTVDSLFAYRKNGKYFMRAAVTNWPADLFVEDFERRQIYEYVPQSGDTALRGPHIVLGTNCSFETSENSLGEKTSPNCTYENSSTQLTAWGGPVPLEHGGKSGLDGRFGVLGIATRGNLVAVGIADDSVTASNVAVLALPMVMNFVPVAFVADLNTLAMLSYVIFTDIFSTLPFLIKGVELINIGTSVRSAVSAIMLGTEEIGQMEIVSAVCVGKDSHRILGGVFIGVALATMVFGFWLEIFARRIMQRRRAKGQDSPFGDMMERVGYGMAGGATEEEKMKWFTREALADEEAGLVRALDLESMTDGSMPQIPAPASTGLRSRLGTEDNDEIVVCDSVRGLGVSTPRGSVVRTPRGSSTASTESRITKSD